MLIFVAGVHGVGKTYLCDMFGNLLDIKHLTASALIKAQASHEVNWDEKKQTSNIIKNQAQLIAAINNEKKAHPRILLDGHLTIVNKDGVPVPVEESVFAELGTSAIILIEDDPAYVQQKLKSRTGNLWGLDKIIEFADVEKLHAYKICQLLVNVKLYVVQARDTDSFRETLLKIINSAHDSE